MPTANFIKKYIDFGKWIAVHHTAIAHVDGTGTAAFDVLAQEILVDDKWRSEMKPTADYFLGWIVPNMGNDETYTDRDGMLSVTAGFLILKKHSDREEYADVWQDCMVDTFNVSRQIITKMIEKSKAKEPLFNHSIDTINQLAPKWSPKYRLGDSMIYSGWLVTFKFDAYLQLLCTPSVEDAAAWV